MTSEANETTSLEKPAESGMTQAQREEMLRDDSLGYIKPVHGIMIAALNMAGVQNCQPGDYVLNGATRIPAGLQGPGFRAGILADRPRAVLFRGNEVVKDTHDPTSAKWQEISAMVSAFTRQDENGKKVSPKCGAELLLWLCDFNCLAILGVFNKERQTLYPKLLNAMNEKKLVQFTTGQKPSANGPVVFQVANPIDGITEAPKYQLADDRRLKAISVFEAYKLVKAAPQTGAPKR